MLDKIFEEVVRTERSIRLKLESIKNSMIIMRRKKGNERKEKYMSETEKKKKKGRRVKMLELFKLLRTCLL